MKQLKLNMLAMAVACSFGTAGVANAGPATDYIVGLMNGTSFIEDDSAESLIKGSHIDPNTGLSVANTGGATVLEVGDVLRGIVRMQKVDGTPVTIAPAAGVELTGVFEAVIVGMSPPSFGLSVFEFAPTGTLVSSLVSNGANFGSVSTAGMGGAMVVMFADNTPDWAQGGATCTATGPGSNCESHAMDGELFAVAGFTGDADEFWRTAPSPADISIITTASEATALGNFGFNLGLLYSAFASTTVVCDPTYNVFWPGAPAGKCGLGDGKVGVVGSGSLLGTKDANGVSVTPYQATDDTDFLVNKASVPEPATLGLLGLGMLGMGAALRRRKI